MTGGYIDQTSIINPLEICEDQVNKTFFEEKKVSVSKTLRNQIKNHCETKTDFHVEEKKKSENEDDEFSGQQYSRTTIFPKDENSKDGETVENYASCCKSFEGVNRKVSLDEFIQVLPSMLSNCKEKNVKKCLPIKDLMENLSIDDTEWEKYAFFDQDRLYTRNLLSTDNETYTLLLLCWTPGRESMIHDHPTDGCWMRCLTGNVVETLYEKDDSEHKMIQKKETWVRKNEVCYIDDSMGYHKVGNPCPKTPAASLHLYSPPFARCKVWPNGCEDSDNCFEPDICYYSIRGEKVQYDCEH